MSRAKNASQQTAWLSQSPLSHLQVGKIKIIPAKKGDPRFASEVCLVRGVCPYKEGAPSTKGTWLGPGVRLPGQVSPAGPDESCVTPQPLRMGFDCLTTSSLRVTSQAGGAQPLLLEERGTKDRSPCSFLTRRARNTGQEGVAFSGVLRGNLIKKQRKII